MTLVLPRYAIVLIAAVGAALLAAPLDTFGEDRKCPVPERFYASAPPLIKTPKALVGGREVVIVALGGASTLGRAAGGAGLAWPARLAASLSDMFSSARIKVFNLAVARQTAKRAAERLDHEVLPLKPNLVIWETGTMEAVRGTDVDEFRETLGGGIDQMRAAGIEVVLMNMQFSRDTDAMIHFGPYLLVMRQLAEVNDVPLFRRHGIMRYWAESGFLDLRAKDAEKSRQVAVKLYDCIGRVMADFVTRGLPEVNPAARPGNGR